MLIWLWTRFDVLSPSGAFETWITALVVLNGLSLVIDVVDVVRYLRGERQPTLTAKPTLEAA